MAWRFVETGGEGGGSGYWADDLGNVAHYMPGGGEGNTTFVGGWYTGPSVFGEGATGGGNRPDGDPHSQAWADYVRRIQQAPAFQATGNVGLSPRGSYFIVPTAQGTKYFVPQTHSYDSAFSSAGGPLPQGMGFQAPANKFGGYGDNSGVWMSDVDNTPGGIEGRFLGDLATDPRHSYNNYDAFKVDGADGYAGQWFDTAPQERWIEKKEDKDFISDTLIPGIVMGGMGAGALGAFANIGPFGSNGLFGQMTPGAGGAFDMGIGGVGEAMGLGNGSGASFYGAGAGAGGGAGGTSGGGMWDWLDSIIESGGPDIGAENFFGYEGLPNLPGLPPTTNLQDWITKLDTTPGGSNILNDFLKNSGFPNAAADAASGSGLLNILGSITRAFSGGGGGFSPLGGLLGGLGGLLGGSRQAGTTTTVEDIPEWQKGLIIPALTSASGLLSRQMNQSNNLLAPAENQMKATIQGDYLNSNPYLDRAFNMGADRITERLSPSFGHMQAFGGNSGYQQALGRSLGDYATQVYGGNYQQERGRQVAAAGAAPGFTTQATSTAWDPFKNFMSVAGGRFGGSQSQPYFNNPFGSMASGALLGGKLFG
jgi:hypothetical protein